MERKGEINKDIERFWRIKLFLHQIILISGMNNFITCQYIFNTMYTLIF
ncbi:hypothetical protein C5167_041568 [Papaver somniferum]|nr:hypothetical protein C5167_041568 [Papaver somniferum]